jgi:hypothetical protein
MKRNSLFFFLILAFFPVIFFSSCAKIRDLAAFDVSYNIPRTTFVFTPTKDKSEEQLIYAGYVSANLDSILNANGLSGGMVGTTTFTKCSITIDQPDSVNFGWLQSLRGEISQTSEPPSEVFGYITAVDPNAKTVNLTLTNINIRPYLGGTSFYIRVYGILNAAVPVEWVQMYIDGTLQLHLEPL